MYIAENTCTKLTLLSSGFKATMFHKQCVNETEIFVHETFHQGIQNAPPYPKPGTDIILENGTHTKMPNYTYCDLQQELDNVNITLFI